MRNLIPCALAALALAGCSCEDPATQRAAGELAIDEKELDFGPACPPPAGQPDAAQTVVRTLHVRNVGAAALYLNQFEVDEAHRALFTFDKAAIPEALEAGDTLALDLSFRPAEVGPVEGVLTVRGDDPDAPAVQIPLRGSGRDLAPRPVIALSCPGGLWPDKDLCKSSSPTHIFPNTPVASTAVMTLLIANEGCPTLHASGFAIDAPGGTPAGTFQVGAGQPPALAAIGGGEPVRLEVWFRPPVESTFNAELAFNTNDPAASRVKVALAGTGTAPVLTLAPPACDFSSKPPCPGVFTVGNAGDLELEVKAVSTRNSSPLFQITKSLAGKKIPPKGSDTVEVKYLPGPRRGADLLVVESNGGAATAALLGGSPPVAALEPPLFLDFGSGLSTTQDYYRPVTVRNQDTYNGQFPLTVESVEIDARPPSNASGTFHLRADPSSPAACPAPPAPGTTIPPGGDLKLCVHFKSAPNGGTFGANLLVHTDDPTRPPPDGYLLSLGASTGCNQAPSAEITWPQAGSCPCPGANEICVAGACHKTGSAQISVTAGAITLSGAASFDRVDDGSGACTREDPSAVALWEWSLDSKPDGSAAGLAPSGRGSSSATTLSLDQKGAYVVRLIVHDRSGLPSAPVTFTVLATP